MTTEVAPPAGKKLSTTERQRLEVCERTIERTLGSFLEAGTALAEIKESRLYRATHPTFAEYVRERWGMGKSRAYQLIGASEVVGEMSTMVDVTLPRKALSTTVDKPANEAQARELAKVPVEARPAVMQAVSDATNGKPTAAAIRRAAEKVAPPSANGERPSEAGSGEPSEDEPAVDPVAEWAAAQSEVERLEDLVDTLKAGDAEEQLAALSRKYGQLEGRVQQLTTEANEAKRQARSNAELLRKIAAKLGVEQWRQIIPAIEDLLR